MIDLIAGWMFQVWKMLVSEANRQFWRLVWLCWWKLMVDGLQPLAALCVLVPSRPGRMHSRYIHFVSPQ